MFAFSAKKDKAAVNAQKEKAANDVEGDDVNKSTTSSSSSSEDKIDETERLKRIQEETAKEKQLRKRKRQEKDDAAYVPSPEHIKKPTKIVLKKKPSQEPSKPPSPPPEPIPHQSPIHSSLHQSPPKHPTPPRQPSPFHLTPPHSPQQIHTITPLTSQQIFQTPPITQPPIQTTPGSSGYKGFPIVPLNLSIGLEDIGDFDFASNAQVKNVEQKVNVVVVENKRVADHEKILKMRTEIDILKVRVAELEEEKTRRDEQNKYIELKNKELEAAKALKEHEFYMMNKVIESMLGKSIEQRFEEIQVEEVRAKRKAEIDAQL
ncbi:hypothetical protein Hanom_Chr14g01262971 [Helianthus anomalus]